MVNNLTIVPGLYGFGTDTRAAYGANNDPTFFIVTNLSTNNGTPGNSTRNGTAVKTGSFLEAINYNQGANTGKIILFEVSGTIGNDSHTTYRSSTQYTSILGETAPSPGIVLKNSSLQVRASDTFVHHIRLRGVPAGAIEKKWDPLYIGPNIGYTTVENVVMDHISVSWGRDETGHIGCQLGATIGNITISNSIISEGLTIDNNHGKGFLVWGDSSTCEPRNILILKNLFASNDYRNPLVKNPSTAIVNNLIYNARDWSITMYTENNEESDFSVVGNVVKGGPWSLLGTSQYIAFMYDLYNHGVGTNIYLADNQCGDGSGGTWTQPNANIWWDESTRRVFMKDNWAWYDYKPATCVLSPPIWPPGLVADSSSSVEEYVLSNVGARPVDRDSVDTRLINEVYTKTGISGPKTSVEAGDWPVLAKNTRKLNIPSTPHVDSGNGYTNLEVWLHALAAGVEGNVINPCLNVICPDVCLGNNLWSQVCDPDTGDCELDQLIESNSSSCGYDPCTGVVCGSVCLDNDLWSQVCDPDTGDCELDQLIESNSSSCVSDLCKGVVCGSVCLGNDLWSQVCDPDTGDCELYQLLQPDSIHCIIPDKIPADETTILNYILLGGLGIMGLGMLILSKKK